MNQVKSPKVVLNYRQNEQIQPFVDVNVEEEIHSHLYSAGKLYQANQKMVKRLTTNSPVIRYQRKTQYVRETFGREILFLADGEGKRHRKKQDTYFTN